MQSRDTADGGFEDPLATVHEDDTGDVDPEVVGVLQRKPWNADIAYDTDAYADMGSDSDTGKPITYDIDGAADMNSDSNPQISPRMQTTARSSGSEDQGQRSKQSQFHENGFPPDPLLCEGQESDMEIDYAFVVSEC